MSATDNVIIAAFDERHKRAVVGPLWQYDYGQILKIEGIDLPLVYEVHFANDPRGMAKTVSGGENGVAIPDEYLTSGANVFAWLFLHTGNDDGATKFEVEIAVRRRAQSSSDTPTPVQRDVIEGLIADMTVATEGVREAKDQAVSAATQAEQDREAAEIAQGLAEAAQRAAEIAQGLAEAAQEAVENASAGLADREITYVHTQSVASAQWTIEHNLDKYPSVTVVDSAGTVVIGDCQYISRNAVVLSFIGAFSGKAYLN